MNLKARIYVENHKKNAQAKFEARLAFLKEKGLNAQTISRDTTLRQIRGLIRQANFRLARIAAQEKLNQEMAQTKAERLAAEKAAREKPTKEREEMVAEIKEKKGKKEKLAKAEKQKKSEPKKGKSEKKRENETPP